MVTNIGNTLNQVADKLSALKTKNVEHDDEENVFLGIGFELLVRIFRKTLERFRKSKNRVGIRTAQKGMI